MSNQQVLEKAIQKAIDSGWEPGSLQLIYANRDLPYRYNLRGDQYAPLFIFNHDFAKALWGQPKKMTSQGAKDAGYRGSLGAGVIDMSHPGWQYHLQQMVVADDPVQYLGANI